MNELNYASLEVSKKLVEAGIILDTDTVWRLDKINNGYFLTNCNPMSITTDTPAASMVEVWRELPNRAICNHDAYSGITGCWTRDSPFIQNTNPANALAELLIWLTGSERYVHHAMTGD